MQTCLNCSKENPEHETYCYACGHILPAGLSGMKGSTTKLEEMIDGLEPRRRWGTAYFDHNNRLQLSIRDTSETLMVDVDDELVLGRWHAETDVPVPDVDLTPYGALEKGVSRRHLALQRDQDTVFVIDLDSANSTYLNGQRLVPHEPRILRDNDELRLGHLVMRVSFA